jgi:uncharacterized membrane protein YozB (DUF420 family)
MNHSAHPLVHLNALLNFIAAVLLVTGYVLVRRGNVRSHRRVMLSAFLVSVAFLTSYLTYHLAVRGGTPTRFPGEGAARFCYLTILGTHTVLAAVVPVLAILTMYYAFRSGSGDGAWTWLEGLTAQAREGALRKHRRLARWTLPIWIYVSVTGVLVYLMLYHLYAGDSGVSILKGE